jgi:hypothetical protein
MPQWLDDAAAQAARKEAAEAAPEQRGTVLIDNRYATWTWSRSKASLYRNGDGWCPIGYPGAPSPAYTATAGSARACSPNNS